MNLIAQILNCKSWDRTKSKNENNAENDDEDNYLIENEYEEDIEFADEAISVLMTHFELPLKKKSNAGVSVLVTKRDAGRVARLAGIRKKVSHTKIKTNPEDMEGNIRL